MRHQYQCTSPSRRTSDRSPAGPPEGPGRPTPPNAFSPEYLAEVRDRDESLTAAEAEFAGPWKLEPLPGHPGAVAVLRESESLAEGDEPEAVWLDGERGVICTVVLPLIEREPLLYLDEAADPNGPQGKHREPRGRRQGRSLQGLDRIRSRLDRLPRVLYPSRRPLVRSLARAKLAGAGSIVRNPASNVAGTAGNLHR